MGKCVKLSKHLGGGKLGLRRYYFRFQQIRIAGTIGVREGILLGGRKKFALKITKKKICLENNNLQICPENNNLEKKLP